MFDEDLPKAKTVQFPRNLDNMSVEELQDYIIDLQAEISRVENDTDKKNRSQTAADSVFKS